MIRYNTYRRYIDPIHDTYRDTIGVNMDWEKWGKVRETTFSEFAPTSHARANVHFLTHVDI